MIEAKSTSRPAQKYGNRGAWLAEAEHMRAHPGDTFVIERRAYPNKAAYALAANTRSGGYVAFRPKGSFDAWVEREGPNLEVIAVYLGEGTQVHDEAGTVAPTPAPVDQDSDGETADPAAPEPETVAAVIEELRSLAKADLVDAAESLGWGPDTYDEEAWTGVKKPELLRDLIRTAEGTIGDDADRAELAEYFGVTDEADEDAVDPASVREQDSASAGGSDDESEVAWTIVGGSKRNPIYAATVIGQDVLYKQGYLWAADGHTEGKTIRPCSFEDARENAVAYVERYLAGKAEATPTPEAGQDSADVDPAPVKGRRTVAVRAS